MKHLSVLAGILLLSAACSSTTTTPAPPRVCAATDCAAGNQCINNGTDIKCRLPCAAHTECPASYQCANNPAPGGPAFCVKNTTDVPIKPTGQWGTTCLPPGGQDANPACDLDNAFICHGTGPTDPSAYCTRTDCATDLDCKGGYWCATVNDKPNIKSADRSFGKTHTVCLKHEYCSPCAANRDCPVIDGKQSRCADDDVGGKYCATVCTASTQCRLDATCTNVVEDGTKVCRPRAGTCKGDGAFCSPCRSDADCAVNGGFCLKGSYSPETFCSVKAGKPCVQGTKSDCPAFTGLAGTQVGCQSTSGDENIPKDQCLGIVELGESGDVGCYTKHP